MKNYSFGKTLKELRHEKNMTQGRLAELLTISPQAVSKWENDIGYPDLPLLLPISEIFGVSIDHLLGKGENTKARDIAEARERTTALWRDDRDMSDECVALWRDLLKKYPSDNECRNALAFELLAPWKEMTEDELNAASIEAIQLYEAVLDESKNSAERSFARSQLVWIYGNLLEKYELAEKVAKQAGSLSCNTPHLMSGIVGHPDRKYWQQYEVWYMTGGLACSIAEQRYENDADAIFAYRTALKIIDTVCYNTKYSYFDSYFSAYFRRCICEKRARLKDLEDSIYDDIREMIESCKRADDEIIGTHLFEGNMFMDSVSFENKLSDDETKWARELLDGMLFDDIRTDERFKKLRGML